MYATYCNLQVWISKLDLKLTRFGKITEHFVSNFWLHSRQLFAHGKSMKSIYETYTNFWIWNNQLLLSWINTNRTNTHRRHCNSDFENYLAACVCPCSRSWPTSLYVRPDNALVWSISCSYLEGKSKIRINC